MKYVKLLLFFIFIPILNIQSQNHWVIFTDKNGTDFDPYSYFDTKAIERRLNIGYDLYDESDFPVNQLYIETVSAIADSVSYASRWMNALSVWASPEAVQKISYLPFVSAIIPIEEEFFLCEQNNQVSFIDSTILTRQLQVMEGDLFKNAGIDGSGVRIAVFDGGFPAVDIHPAFEHLRKNNRIIKTFDFVRKREFVYSYNSHGTSVLSVIAGIYNGKRMGLATGAEFLLARTEKNTEPFSEEVNWVAALEWADQNGADIVNSSLGYTYQRYFPFQMDGQTAFVSKMANKAASKGILVVNAAGNEGDNNWTIIGAPADADSILTVGGIDPYSYYRISFSSVGPTADYRRKPNVTAFGQAIVAGKTGLKSASGTSFASPLVAGFAACTKQAHPELEGFELKQFIEQSGKLYPYFDYGHGYGVPQASKVMNKEAEEKNPTFFVSGEELPLKLTIPSMNETIPPDEGYETDDNYLYFAYSDSQGMICEWGIISVYQSNFDLQPPLKCPETISVQLHFRGYTETVQFKQK